MAHFQLGTWKEFLAQHDNKTEAWEYLVNLVDTTKAAIQAHVDEEDAKEYNHAMPDPIGECGACGEVKQLDSGLCLPCTNVIMDDISTPN